MECVVEAVTTTRKKVAIVLSAEEVNAAIAGAVAEYRKDLALPGFRKGKVPAGVVERRFGEEIRGRATQDKLQAAVEQALQDNKLIPISGIEMDNSNPFAKDEAFTCSVSFDVLPTIEFPVYEGLAVDQTKAEATEDDIQEIMTRLRDSLAEAVDLTEDRLPQDGDVVDADYAGFDESGAPVDDVKGEHFSITLGQKQALDDFEALIKTARIGEEKEGPVAFPADYGHAPLAGKTVTFRIKINSIKARQLPEVNDDFAKKVGHDDLEKLRAAIVEHTSSSKAQAARGEAMKKLVDGLLPQVTYDVPESMIQARIGRILNERAMRLQRMGKSLDELGKSKDELTEEAKAEALETLRPQVFLMALARKENLSVSDQEVEMAIYSMAMRAQQDYKQVREAYHRSGLIHELRDRILADKAVECIYSKAVITEIEPDTAVAADA